VAGAGDGGGCTSLYRACAGHRRNGCLADRGSHTHTDRNDCVVPADADTHARSDPGVTPTPDPRPARGPELLVDDFTDSGHWQVVQSAAGSVAYGRSELTLAVRQSKASVSSLRDGPELGDFYLEITTKASLCRGDDTYGLLLRAASANDYYRFLINCNGELRVERILDGRSLPLQDWTQSGIVPAGSPVVLRIGVVASGRQMSFFINDLHQLDIDDRTHSSGRVGVYARSSGDSALSVSFSDLVVTGLAPGGEE
jgi:hypothetical protein